MIPPISKITITSDAIAAAFTDLLAFVQMFCKDARDEDETPRSVDAIFLFLSLP
jgi:hypothetical protein